jgi:hypothetical protein
MRSAENDNDLLLLSTKIAVSTAATIFHDHNLSWWCVVVVVLCCGRSGLLCNYERLSRHDLLVADDDGQKKK